MGVILNHVTMGVPVMMALMDTNAAVNLDLWATTVQKVRFVGKTHDANILIHKIIEAL